MQDLQAFIKRLDAQGIKLDEPDRKDEATGNALISVINPWDTRIELVQTSSHALEGDLCRKYEETLF